MKVKIFGFLPHDEDAVKQVEQQLSEILKKAISVHYLLQTSQKEFTVITVVYTN